MFGFSKLLFKYWPDAWLVALCGIGLHGLWFLLGFEALNARECEGDTEMRPLIYRDSLRQGEPNRCDTLTQW